MVITSPLWAVVVSLLTANAAPAASRPPQSYAMKRAVDASAIARARQITVRLSDLRHQVTLKTWFVNVQWKPGLINRTGPPLIHCQGHYADLSSLTFRGGWATRFDRIVTPTVWQLTSSAVILATPGQAQHYFVAATTWEARYCLKNGLTVGGVRLTSVRRVQPPDVADDQAEFRFRQVTLNTPGNAADFVVVFLRRGTVNVQLSFEWVHTPIPNSLINAIARTVAGRAG